MTFIVCPVRGYEVAALRSHRKAPPRFPPPDRQEVTNMDFVEKIIGLSVGLVVVSIMGVLGINAIVNTTFAADADPSIVMMFQVLIPIIYVIGIIMYMLNKA